MRRYWINVFFCIKTFYSGAKELGCISVLLKNVNKMEMVNLIVQHHHFAWYQTAKNIGW